MPLLPVEYRGSICEVKTLDNNLFATGVISGIAEDYIEIEDRSNAMSVAHFGTEMKVNVYNHRQGFRVLVGKVYISTSKFIRIIEVINLLDYERRHFFRVDTDIRGSIRHYLGEEAEKKRSGNEDDDLERTRVLIKNLSLGGALLLSEGELEEGTKLVLELSLTRRFCSFCCIVRRISENDSGARYYGCEFFDSSDLNTNALCAYVFQRQREQINKREVAEPLI